jgi:hypothetical protein
MQQRRTIEMMSAGGRVGKWDDVHRCLSIESDNACTVLSKTALLSHPALTLDAKANLRGPCNAFLARREDFTGPKLQFGTLCGIRSDHRAPVVEKLPDTVENEYLPSMASVEINGRARAIRSISRPA